MVDASLRSPAGLLAFALAVGLGDLIRAMALVTPVLRKDTSSGDAGTVRGRRLGDRVRFTFAVQATVNAGTRNLLGDEIALFANTATCRISIGSHARSCCVAEVEPVAVETGPAGSPPCQLQRLGPAVVKTVARRSLGSRMGGGGDLAKALSAPRNGDRAGPFPARARCGAPASAASGSTLPQCSTCPARCRATASAGLCLPAQPIRSSTSCRDFPPRVPDRGRLDRAAQETSGARVRHAPFTALGDRRRCRSAGRHGPPGSSAAHGMRRETPIAVRAFHAGITIAPHSFASTIGSRRAGRPIEYGGERSARSAPSGPSGPNLDTSAPIPVG